MHQFLEEAKALEAEIIANRRYLHEHPECGFDLENTCRFVMEKLTEYGYEPKMICRSGIAATVGRPGKTIMLRADMDALPMEEETDLPFRSKEKRAHTCGHDTHTAMLLGAAKILKQHEAELNGTVKLMFQPDEEGTSPTGISGGDVMLEAGVLENPKVDAVMSLHIMSGSYPSGSINIRKGPMMSSSDTFEITVQGSGTHGSQPNLGVDPINVAVHIYEGLQNLIARELAPEEQACLTVGSFQSGDAANIIPDEAKITGTIRTTHENTRTAFKDRIREISEHCAAGFRAKADVKFMHGIPSVYNDPKLTEELIAYTEDMMEYPCEILEYPMSGSDDLSVISQNAPTAYFMLGSGTAEEGYLYPHHNPHILFNEEVFYKGTAMYVNAAIEWLKNH
ncbi:amidohydrolase [Clostridiaceae bacterium DONG20-135]|uniref:Amidohydrolase n=1 Tax=Copranaerobaculum intestinale TaxID=2692629 RepID=A0A6N8U7A1_9FIRM|nr:M20 family metallopeptidase [Copranaerobaculum intestinale]MXQ72409.1 amidohydrolase [Copranaerobaculum intestinale]